MANLYADRDLELWRAWRKSRSEADLEALFRQFDALSRREAGRYASIAPLFLLTAEAKTIMRKAFDDFDPNRAIKLSTFVTSRLQKLSRTAYARQSTTSVPEHQRLTFNRYNRAKARLEDELGHPPSHDAIADHLGLPPAKLLAIVHNVERKEFLESGEGPAFAQATDDDRIHLAFRDLTPQQQRIFELRTGYGGHVVQSGAQICQTLGITQGVLSYELGKIKAVLARMQRGR